MASISFSKLLFSSLVLAAIAVASVNGIKCYQCGLVTSSGSSITPCQNLTSGDLKECQPDAVYCSKHDSPAIKVYGCEKHCDDGRTQGLFTTYCCNENACNGAMTPMSGGQWMVPLATAVGVTLMSFWSAGSTVSH